MRPRLTRASGWTSENGRQRLDRLSVAGMPVRAMTPAPARVSREMARRRQRRQQWERLRDLVVGVSFTFVLAMALAIAYGAR